jgi:chaperonin cofactor prefoldin
MTRRFFMLFLALCVPGLLSAACSKGSPQMANANSEQAKQQAEGEAKAPHLSKTVKGDIERMGLAVQAALDAVKDNKWSEVMTQLNTVDKELAGAMADTPEKKKTGAIRDALQEMKPAVERTIKTAENRGKETEGQIRDLQTRVNALKTFANISAS